MPDHRFSLIRSRVNGLALLALAVLVLGGAWSVSAVLAQDEGGSEPGAMSMVADTAIPDKLKLTSRSTSAGVSSPSEPGMDAPSVEELAPTTSPWPTHWYTVVGSAFTPSNSTIAYTYGSNGCIKPSTTGQWRASVNLPDGSVIKYIYINYYNGDAASTASSTAWLTRYIFTGLTSDLVTVTSRAGTTTGTGYYFDLSPELTSIVDNLSSGYMFVWSGSTGQNLCSIQVGYYPPTFGAIALPFIQK